MPLTLPSRDRDRPAERRLALREIAGNLTITDSAAWAWYALPATRWAFRSDVERANLVTAVARRYAALAGHRLHLRVTNRPYPTAAWAAGLDEITPAPLPGWGDHLIAEQEHQRRTTMADKEVYLGVRLASRSTVDRLADLVLRRASEPEIDRAKAAAGRITEVIAGDGLAGRPATAREVEWLLHRSVGLGLPAPALLSPNTAATWTADDLDAFTDGVTFEAVPFGRTVKVVGRAGSTVVERYVAVLTLGRTMPVDVPDNTRDPWQAATDRLPFPVEWSSRVDVLPGAEARAEVGRKLLVIRDMQRHYAEHDLDSPTALARQAGHAIAAEDEMTNGSEAVATRAYGWHRLAVAGDSEAEALERARKVADLYGGREWEIAHPRGQYALLREFTPGEPVGSTAYRRRQPVLYFAAGLPTTTSTLGDRRGPSLGFTSGSSRRAVMYDTHYATEIAERPNLTPIIAEPGAGKSVLLGTIAYKGVRRGITTTLLDPSGPLAALCSMPELAAHSRHLDLTTGPDGLLNPYAVIPSPSAEQYPDTEERIEAGVRAEANRKMLALDVARMLLPPSIADDGRTSVVLMDAVREVGGLPTASLMRVVEALEARADEHGKVVARYLRDMREMPGARLFFPTSARPFSQEEQEPTLLVLTLGGLVLPDANTPREQWTLDEQVAVPLLHLGTYFATRRVYGRPRAERKIIGLDETHFLGQWAAGRALFTRLGRDSRKWNTWTGAASQNPSDVLSMDVSNLVGSVFVGHVEDEQTAAEALRLLRVKPGSGYEAVLASLPSGAGRGDGPNYREFVMRDVDGNVDKVRIDLASSPELLAALNTTAPGARRQPVTA